MTPIFFQIMKKGAKLRRNHCKKNFFANGKCSKFSNLWPKLMPAKTQNVVYRIFSSILLNMSQLTDKVTRYSTCRYHMSSRQKNTKNPIKLLQIYTFCSNSCQMLLRSRIMVFRQKRMISDAPTQYAFDLNSI